MKPNCPYLKSGGDPKTQERQAVSSAPNNFSNNPPAQPGQPSNPNPNNHARPPLVTQSDITKLVERMKQQAENMERRMLEAMRNAMSSSNPRQTQARAVRSADEEVDPQSEMTQLHAAD